MSSWVMCWPVLLSCVLSCLICHYFPIGLDWCISPSLFSEVITSSHILLVSLVDTISHGLLTTREEILFFSPFYIRISKINLPWKFLQELLSCHVIVFTFEMATRLTWYRPRRHFKLHYLHFPIANLFGAKAHTLVLLVLITLLSFQIYNFASIAPIDNSVESLESLCPYE